MPEAKPITSQALGEFARDSLGVARFEAAGN
jgi:hypothetical protein